MNYWYHLDDTWDIQLPYHHKCYCKDEAWCFHSDLCQFIDAAEWIL